MYALSSAALTRAISKACSIGATTKCSCGRLPNEPAPGEFKWGGCGDDIYFGLAFSKLFADAQFAGKKRKLSKRSQVNLHNTGVGRKVSMRHLLCFPESKSLHEILIHYFLKPQFRLKKKQELTFKVIDLCELLSLNLNCILSNSIIHKEKNPVGIQLVHSLNLCGGQN